MSDPKFVILCIDDDAAFLESLAAVLELEFEVHTTNSPKIGLLLLKRRAFDVVITDWQMPEMDGITVARRMIEFGSNSSCLILTGRANELLGQMDFDKMRAVATLAKNGDPEQLIERVKTMGRFARGRSTLAAMKART